MTVCKDLYIFIYNYNIYIYLYIIYIYIYIYVYIIIYNKDLYSCIFGRISGASQLQKTRNDSALFRLCMMAWPSRLSTARTNCSSSSSYFSYCSPSFTENWLISSRFLLPHIPTRHQRVGWAAMSIVHNRSTIRKYDYRPSDTNQKKKAFVLAQKNIANIHNCTL